MKINNFEYDNAIRSFAMPCRICKHRNDPPGCPACRECVFVDGPAMEVDEIVCEVANERMRGKS